MKKINSLTHRILLALCLILGIGIFLPYCGTEAEASSGYKQLIDYDGNKTVIKNGKYYFKIDKSSQNLLISTKRNSGYKKTPIVSYGSFGNGKQAFYIYKNTLYKYTYASRTKSKLKKLPVKGDVYYYISSIYGNQIFITKDSFYQWKHWTYSYNINTKKFKKVTSNCTITARSGNYAVGQNEYRTDVGAYPITLYKIKNSGLSKVKKLTSFGRSATFAGNKLYYVHYSNKYMRKATLYRCNRNGTNRKAIKTFTASQKYDVVLITNITSKSCDVYKDGKNYRYHYSTKKMKKI